MPHLAGEARLPETKKNMKTDIHPAYHQDAVANCSCGNTFGVGSTSESLRVELCSKCHPFFTGEQKIVDTEGRVERLMRRYNLGAKTEQT